MKLARLRRGAGVKFEEGNAAGEDEVCVEAVVVVVA